MDVVAGLLQTEGYARHIIDSYDRVEPIAPSHVTRLVRVRMRRQQVLDRTGLKLNVVLDESVLLRRIGSDLIMYEQLQRLAKECERPNLTLQILPLDGPHTVIGESFVLFGFEADGDAVLQDVVSTEQMRSGFILEGERETHLHRVAFRTLTEAALSPADSKQLILDTAESRWAGARQTVVLLAKATCGRYGEGGSPGSLGNPPCCFGRLCAEAVELAVPNATDERVPFVWREAENRASSIPAVPDANFAAGQARHLNAVTVGETQRAFHPFGLIFERRHSVATLH